jgi:hypothetical protein
MRIPSPSGLLTLLASTTLLAIAAIGLAHSALDSREQLLVAMGAAGLILLPLGARRALAGDAAKAHA